jgi:hypothetical protein
MGTEKELALQIAERTHELLSDETRWTKGANARTRQNKPTAPFSSNAVCFCLTGAVTKAVSEIMDEGLDTKTIIVLSRAQNLVFRTMSEPKGASALMFWEDKTSSVCKIMRYNDAADTTHEDVLSLIQEATKLLKNEP